MIGEGIDQCPRIVAVAGMDHHAGRFIDNNDVVVFVGDVKRNVFGNNLNLANWIGQDDRDAIEWFDLVT